MTCAWSPYPLADAILAEYDPHPLLLLAAWTCKYRDDCEALTDLAYRAAERRDLDGAAA